MVCGEATTRGPTFMCTSHVHIFSLRAPTNRHDHLSQWYKKQKCIKKRAYEQRVREAEHASFTPVVLAVTGEWPMRQHTSAKDRFHSLHENRTSHTVSLCLDYVFNCLFPCYTRSFNVSGEHSPVVATPGRPIDLVISESGLDNI